MDFESRLPLFDLSTDDFVTNLENTVQETPDLINTDLGIKKRLVRTRKRQINRNIDHSNPIQAGWVYLLSKKLSQNSELIKTMKPLAVHRGMKKPEEPLIFDGSTNLPDWSMWIKANVENRRDENGAFDVPEYILIIGDAKDIPFKFQSTLHSATLAVGRIYFDDLINDLKTYVDKIIAQENNNLHTVKKLATVFAPDRSLAELSKSDDATLHSHNRLAKPMAKFIADRGVTVDKLFAQSATKENLVNSMNTSNSAFFYTASHGLGTLNNYDENLQKKLTGAIECQDAYTTQNQNTFNAHFTAENISDDATILDGGIFFQFSCFGYGTPSQSYFSHWCAESMVRWGKPKKIASSDFIAAIPKKLLSLKNGPIAFIGHCDIALVSFSNEDNISTDSTPDPRIAPFLQLAQYLLANDTIGSAMTGLQSRAAIELQDVQFYTEQKHLGQMEDTFEYRRKVSTAFKNYIDAENFMIFGDPAVKLKVSD